MTPLLEVKRLTKSFSIGSQSLQAVNQVSFSVLPGEVLGIVGESGSGKSTLSKLMLRLMKVTSGSILFDGIDITHLSDKQLKPFRKHMQMVFQNPTSSLNPRMTVETILKEPLLIHQWPSSKIQPWLEELLEFVGLKQEHLKRFPSELSGGQKQRIAIARALALKPRFLICDEPFSALDVSVQAQIINLLKQLQQCFNLTCILISHDLAVVRYLANRIGVMYLGELVELASVEQLYQTPLHPYTQALISAIPIPDPHLERSRIPIVLKGEMPSPINLPSGCPFQSRCPFAQPICQIKKPEWKEWSSGHFAACHFTRLKDKKS